MDLSWICIECVATGVIFYLAETFMPSLTDTPASSAIVVILSAMGAKMINYGA